jgi:integrating conjugative element protein (TIGR03761 family)
MITPRPLPLSTVHPSGAQFGQPVTPGVLQGQVWLSVQTLQAQRLIHGRQAKVGKPNIVGLVGFADRLRVLWLAARRDDPYADWWLIQVHEAIEAASASIRCEQVRLDEQLAQLNGMEVSVAASTRPCRIQLQFANPYAYRGAQLLSTYDRLVCTALTARHIGLLDGAHYRQVQEGGARKLRALFLIPQGYRLLKIDREIVRLNKGRSSEARKLMGTVPEVILSGERQAPFAPRKVNVPGEMAAQVELHPASSPARHSPDPENDDG